MLITSVSTLSIRVLMLIINYQILISLSINQFHNYKKVTKSLPYVVKKNSTKSSCGSDIVKKPYMKLKYRRVLKKKKTLTATSQQSFFFFINHYLIVKPP